MAKNRGLPEERGPSGRAKQGAGSVPSTGTSNDSKVASQDKRQSDDRPGAADTREERRRRTKE